MYYLGVRDDFSAAHILKGYDGKCSRLHGHNWKIEAVFRGEELNSIDISEDFKNLKNALKFVLEEFDHNYLNEIEYFETSNPSAENISRILNELLQEKIEEEGYKVEVYEVKVWESDRAWVSFNPYR